MAQADPQPSKTRASSVPSMVPDSISRQPRSVRQDNAGSPARRTIGRVPVSALPTTIPVRALKGSRRRAGVPCSGDITGPVPETCLVPLLQTAGNHCPIIQYPRSIRTTVRPVPKREDGQGRAGVRHRASPQDRTTGSGWHCVRADGILFVAGVDWTMSDRFIEARSPGGTIRRCAAGARSGQLPLSGLQNRSTQIHVTVERNWR